MARQVTTIPREDVTDDMLEKSAALFSENYGIWGTAPQGTSIPGRPGNRVKMNAARLRKQCLPEGSDSIFVHIMIGNVLAGHAFACRWQYQDLRVLWITQLVVHSDFRRRRIATILLMNCLDLDDDVFGIMSSHPAACKALAKAFGDVPFTKIPLDFAKNHASGVLGSSPIEYIRDAEPRGSAFNPDDATGMVMGVDSHFFVDHAEPLEALYSLQADGKWPLGNLLDGHEFMFLFERSKKRRSSSSRHRSKTPCTQRKDA